MHRSHKLQKNTKSLFWGSRSFKVIDVNTAKMFVTIFCYDKQHLFAYLQPFYATRANSGKITTFKEGSLLELGRVMT